MILEINIMLIESLKSNVPFFMVRQLFSNKYVFIYLVFVKYSVLALLLIVVLFLEANRSFMNDILYFFGKVSTLF